MHSCFPEGKPRFLAHFVFLLQGIEQTMEMTPDEVSLIKQSGSWNRCQLPSNVKTRRIGPH